MYLKFKFYEIHEKSAFLNGYLDVEVSQDVRIDVNDMVGVIVKDNANLMIDHIYVYDIVFGETSIKMVDHLVQ